MEGRNNASCDREIVAGEIPTAEDASRGSNHEGCHGDSALRGRVGVGSNGRSRASGLVRGGLQTGYQKQLGQGYKKPVRREMTCKCQTIDSVSRRVRMEIKRAGSQPSVKEP